MSKSSLEYSEMAGLNIALSNLRLIDATCQDEDWIAITSWMNKRINELSIMLL
jgi:hypothetical protein